MKIEKNVLGTSLDNIRHRRTIFISHKRKKKLCSTNMNEHKKKKKNSLGYFDHQTSQFYTCYDLKNQYTRQCYSRTRGILRGHLDQRSRPAPDPIMGGVVVVSPCDQQVIRPYLELVKARGTGLMALVSVVVTPIKWASIWCRVLSLDFRKNTIFGFVVGWENNCILYWHQVSMVDL